MCATCGCSGATHEHEHGPDHAHAHPPDPDGGRLVKIERDLLEKNARLAERNRGWFEGRGILAINLLSSPGAGKTTLLERTVRALGGGIAVIEGDQATSRDAERIRAAGARAAQINTGTGCHLDAHLVSHALPDLNPAPGSLLFIENVGNLVCPALFDLGERFRVLVASVAEGEDKPLKYPHMFRAAHVLLLNKVDLLPHLAFDVDLFLSHLREVNPRAKVLRTSATRGDGLEDWLGWLEEQRTSVLRR